MGNTVIAFPGQGAQQVGMVEVLKDNNIARDLFDEASNILGYDLFDLCLSGPEGHLTQMAQPALFVTCLAYYTLLADQFQPSLYAGHSLGELTALAASRAFSFGDGVRIVKKRGELMNQGGDSQGMTAILGLDEQPIQRLCEESRQKGWVQIANYNSPGQIVVSGELQALQLLEVNALKAGAKKVVPLPVSGAFHSRLMAPAAQEFAAFLTGFQFEDPHIPVISNAKSQLITKGTEVRDELISQLTSPVRWIDNVGLMEAQGMEEFVEISPSAVLGGLTRRITKKMKITLAKPKGDVVA